MGENGDIAGGPAVAAGSVSATAGGPGLVLSGRLVAALLGFVAGAVFWHLVGFWSLVSEMVFSGPREKTVVLSNPIGRRGDDTPNRSGRSAAAEGHGRDGAGIAARSQMAGDSVGPGDARNGLSTANCTTLSQDQPGGPITRVPCPVGGQASGNSVVSDGFIDDLVTDWVSGYPNVRVHRPALASGNRDRNAITTGSVGSGAQRGASRAAVGGWATSLDVTVERDNQ